MTAPTALPVTPQDAVDPNWVWRTIRVMLRNVFGFYLRYRARGHENLPAGGALLLVNHQSFLDPLFVGLPLSRPVSFLARENLFRVPFVGWAIRNTYVMPMRRDAAVTDALREATRRVEQGFYVGIFPEGTRSRTEALGELKPGFIALVRRCKSPVIPIGISGGTQIMPRGALFIRPRRVHVVFGEPISWEQLEPLTRKGREQELIALATQRIDSCRAAAERWRLEQ
jgi:1-acyl-sn-glycerol-3-phosphate acyltransferase